MLHDSNLEYSIMSLEYYNFSQHFPRNVKLHKVSFKISALVAIFKNGVH